jgi:hypothetical protein
MDYLPPPDRPFFLDKSVISAEVRQPKHRQHPEMPEAFFAWSLALPPSLQALAAQPWFNPITLLRSRAPRAAFAF